MDSHCTHLQGVAILQELFGALQPFFLLCVELCVVQVLVKLAEHMLHTFFDRKLCRHMQSTLNHFVFAMRHLKVRRHVVVGCLFVQSYVLLIVIFFSTR